MKKRYSRSMGTTKFANRSFVRLIFPMKIKEKLFSDNNQDITETRHKWDVFLPVNRIPHPEPEYVFSEHSLGS